LNMKVILDSSNKTEMEPCIIPYPENCQRRRQRQRNKRTPLLIFSLPPGYVEQLVDHHPVVLPSSNRVLLITNITLAGQSPSIRRQPRSDRPSKQCHHYGHDSAETYGQPCEPLLSVRVIEERGDRVDMWRMGEKTYVAPVPATRRRFSL
jgi:hypothetical protein